MLFSRCLVACPAGRQWVLASELLADERPAAGSLVPGDRVLLPVGDAAHGPFGPATVRRRDARGVWNGGRGFELVSVAWLLRGTGHRALFVRGQVAPARDLLEKEGGARRERRGERRAPPDREPPPVPRPRDPARLAALSSLAMLTRLREVAEALPDLPRIMPDLP